MTEAPMPADPVVALLPVTQEDRDLAHEILHRVRGFAVNIPHDQHWLIQHLARHRTPTPVSGDVPSGWKLVPVEPTREIVDAMETVEHPNNHAAFYCDLYAAMLAASPTPDSSAVSGSAEGLREGRACHFCGVAYSHADLEIAQRAACAIVPFYGTGDHGEQEAARDGKLWNDHPAVQGALRALHEARLEGEKARG